MSEWKKVKFLDVVHLNPRISLEKGVEYPFVEMSNVVPCARKPEKDVFKKYLGEGTKFEQGDTIVARIEPCLQNGKGFQCSYKQGFGSTEFLVFRPVNINDLDCDFLYYYMGQQSIREAMAKTMVGASGRQRVNNKVFNDLQINLPPLSTQHCIANILSRYDSLIENYQKQIKLLEEAAQRLYKEWFIDLHFPEHENTKIVDGVPEGWEKKSIGEIGEYLNGFAFKPSDWQELGKPIIKIKEMGNGVTNDTPRNNGERVPAKYLIKAGDLLFSWSATLMVIIWSGEDGWLNQHLFKVTPAKGINREFLLQSISNTIVEFQNLTTGSTMKHIQRNKLDQVFVNVPNAEIMKRYSDISEKTRSNILSLQSQLRLLTEARDRLLPKLMSGEITV